MLLSLGNLKNRNIKQKIVKSNNPILFQKRPLYAIRLSNKTIGELVIDKIIEKNGVGTNIYGVTGAATYAENQNIQNAIDSGELNYIHSTNESAGIYMASYEAEILKKVGIHFCTSGPGTAMAVTAVSSIYDETKPCIIICGTATGNFQFLDVNIMKLITKKIIVINKSTINPQNLINDAFSIALNGTTEFPGPGPVGLFIDEEIWNNKYKISNNVTKYHAIIYYKKVDEMINTIFADIKKHKKPKIILRVGGRVSVNNLTKLAELTSLYPNIYLHLTFLSKSLIDSTSYINVGIEGPLGNTYVNENYASAKITIDIGNDITYSLFDYMDVKELMPKKSSIYYCIDQKLPYRASSSNSSNTIKTNANYFVRKLISMIHKTNNLTNNSWSNTKSSQNTYFIDLINSYTTQTYQSTGYSTTGTVIGYIVKKIYALQTYNTGVDEADQTMLITDNNLYCADMGAASFIFGSLINHSNPNYALNFVEFSPIGSSLGAAGGRMRTNQYSDLIHVIGDGGFFNNSGSLIDYVNSICSNPDTRVLFIFMNDNKYSNVAIGEESLFGTTTDVSSTSDIQQNIDCNNWLITIFGSNLQQQLLLDDNSDINTDVSNFVENWYSQATPGFTNGGFYLISYTTQYGTPTYIKSTVV